VARFPAKIGHGDGDGVVPIRSSLRSKVWQAQPATAAASGGGGGGGGAAPTTAESGAGHALVHRVYPGMSHASCLKPDSPAARRCFNDVLSALVNGTWPATDV